MAALIEDPRLGVSASPNSDPVTQGLYGNAEPQRAQHASPASNVGEALKARMPDMVKGAGMAFKGGNTPLTDQTDIMTRSAQAALDLRGETYRGFRAKSAVVGELNQGWLNNFGALKTALTMPSLGEQISQLVGMIPGGAEALKSFTAGNLGIGSVSM